MKGTKLIRRVVMRDLSRNIVGWIQVWILVDGGDGVTCLVFERFGELLQLVFVSF